MSTQATAAVSRRFAEEVIARGDLSRLRSLYGRMLSSRPRSGTWAGGLKSNYLQASNELGASTAGDLNPRWVEVWAHIDLAKVRKMISQPEWGAAAEFRELKQALKTGDDTFGAQDEVLRLLKEIGVEVQPRILDPRLPIEPIEKTPAAYTDEASIAELEGTVLLDGVIGDDGLARDLTVLRPLGLGLDEKAIESARQWVFTPIPNNGQAPPAHVLIAVDFFLRPKPSRWHLVRVNFSLPAGAARPFFLKSEYPRGAGVSGDSAIEEGRLLGGIGRQASARVSFDIDEHGIPQNIEVIDASEPVWGAQAAPLVSQWRFNPGAKDGKPIPVRCSVDLIWGTRDLTPAIVEAFQSAAAAREWDREFEKATKNPSTHR